MKHLQGFHGNERVSFPCFLNINRLSPRATFKRTFPSLPRTLSAPPLFTFAYPTHGFDSLFRPRLIRVKKRKKTTLTSRNLRPIIRRDVFSLEAAARKREARSQSRRVESNTGPTRFRSGDHDDDGTFPR